MSKPNFEPTSRPDYGRVRKTDRRETRKELSCKPRLLNQEVRQAKRQWNADS